ncbi:KpsF/GutQ family sugar-phosphate isomerase [Hoeflea prorocentri]|uniref:KpsF/GutQ family sugar-phosphate isomerase n=1 Tax=Hoeflea prorocentri TaxID=1922333 RepID=A0A9X3UJA4_9HYPH|nr:KpsF/GutQ family sugar-phosphate isomerase [Hoeflea prorocentri]MCY6381626.1 KpsF/GutQ family sugar-phosphate isomerase [Hoeflea prorocentri]MDA5399426.1 KpsF/GutQ family sugar-phosphate isomerase [Hoeflea prorocentri]
MSPERNIRQEILKAARTSLQGIDTIVEGLNAKLGDSVLEAIDVIAAKSGRLIITGVGKSGHIGAKAAATFASTGTPAQFVHSAEASHGDLGMITPDDCVLAISNSGETRELSDVLYHARRADIPLIALTSKSDSTLAQNATVTVVLPQAEEACPLGLAPTTSSMMQLMLCDTMAIGLLVRRGFSESDFKHFHPGGTLGASLTLVRDAMHAGDAMPIVRTGTPLIEAIGTINEKGFGLVIVVDEAERMRGVITDGDLRRNAHVDAVAARVDDIMTVGGLTVEPDMLLASALKMIQDHKVGALVVEDDGQAVGVIHVLDMLRIGAA